MAAANRVGGLSESLRSAQGSSPTRRPRSSRISAAVTETLESRRMLAKIAPFVPPAPTGQKYDDGPAFIDGHVHQSQVIDRWVTTASGSAGSQGSGMTLTYSFPSDTLSVPGNNGEPTSNNVLNARLNSLYGSQANWLPVFQQVFASWSAISGITYVYQPTDDNAPWGTAGQLGVRGDVRIVAHPYDGANGVLAYNFFPNSGGSDMVIDSNDLSGGGYMAVTSGNSIRLRNVAEHEHGHGLGFAHVDPVSQTKLMEPFVTTIFDGPQLDDMLSVQRNYGDAFEKSGGNNLVANATNRGTITTTSDSITNVSTSNTSDVDYYKFTFTGNKIWSVTLSPTTAAAYQQGPQNQATSLFDPKTQADLQVQVIGSNGTTVISNSNGSGLGGSETISGLNLAAGTYYLRVFDAAGSPNGVQLYNLNSTFAVGGTPLVANLTSVSPDPRQAAVSSIDMTFSEPIVASSFDASDLVLTRDGNPVDATGATVTTSDNVHFTIGNLAGITGRAGEYTITTLNTIQTTDGRTLNTPPSDTWLMTAIIGTSGDDTIRLVKGNNGIDVYSDLGATPDYSFLLTNMPSVQIFAGAGNDTILIEYPAGSGAPFPTGGLTVDGGAHTTADTLQIKGSATGDFYTTLAANTITRGSSPSGFTITHSNLTDIEMIRGQLRMNTDLNGLDVTSNSGSTLVLNVSQHLAALTVNTGGVANFTANGNRTLSLSSLAVSGKLDLFDNDMIVTGTPRQTIEGYIASAYNFGDWLGTTGVFSTTAKNNANGNTMLGLLTGDEFANNNGGTFAGVTPNANDVLVKYTYFGDVDFNGSVDVSDYNLIDFGFTNHLTGWGNGDVDYSGAVDASDYNVIDFAFATQGSAL